MRPQGPTVNPRQHPSARTDTLIGIAVILYTILLVALPRVLETAAFKQAFSEDGPFEQLSILGWLLAAATVLARVRPLNKVASAFALLFLVFAAREADWHKAFTHGSLLSLKYYWRAVAPIGEKLLAGLAAGAVVALIVYTGIQIVKYLFIRRGWRKRAGFWLLLASALVVLGKLLDRAPAVLGEDYHVVLSPLARLYTQAFEEGYEMLHPLLMARAMWLGQTQGLFNRFRSAPARLPAQPAPGTVS